MSAHWDETWEPTEVSSAEDHLGPSPDTEDEAWFDDEAAALLGTALRPVAPPAALRAHLLTAVESDHAPGATVLPLMAPASGRRRRPGVWLWRVAAVLVLIGTGFGAGRWSAMDAMADTQHYAHLNQAQDVKRVTDTMADGHVATLTWSQDMSMTALSLPAAMMPQTKGQSLQVWLRDAKQITSLGTYDPESGTGFSFLDVMPKPGQEILITLEPAGGSAQPTTAPLVVLRVSASSTQA